MARGAARDEAVDDKVSVFAPAPLVRPKSALTLRVRGQLSHVKGMANLVLQGRGSEQLPKDDLTTGRLLLDRDSEVTIDKAAQSREREMRYIVDRRQQRYNHDRLTSDRKEDVLAKMMVQLDALEAAHARNDTINRFEEQASQRMEEVREEMNAAESAMAEAVTYTETLGMMTQRLVSDITNRRKLQHEMDRALGELRRELNVVCTHQRTILAAERDALETVDKLQAHLESRRAMHEEQISRRKAMAEAFTNGGGHDGKDLVAEARAKHEARQQSMQTAQAQQLAVRWTLDSLKTTDEKMHLGNAPLTPGSTATAPSSKPATPSISPTSPGCKQRRSSNPSSAKIVGRKISLPFASSEVRRLTGAVNPDEHRALRSGTFAQYMQVVHARTSVTDGPYVLRRLHHWVNTEKNVQGQSVAVQRRYESLRREHSALTEELERARAAMLLEGSHEEAPMPRTHAMADDAGGGADWRLTGGHMSGRGSGFAPSGSRTETDGRLDAVSAAKARLSHMELQCQKRTRQTLDAAAALNNLVDRLRTAAPSVDGDIRAELRKKAREEERRELAMASDDGDGEEGGEEGDGEESEEEDDETEMDLGDIDDGDDEVAAAYNVFVRQVPRKLATSELVLERLLSLVDEAALTQTQAGGAPLTAPLQREQRHSREAVRGADAAAAPGTPHTAMPGPTAAAHSSAGSFRAPPSRIMAPASSCSTLHSACGDASTPGTKSVAWGLGSVASAAASPASQAAATPGRKLSATLSRKSMALVTVKSSAAGASTASLGAPSPTPVPSLRRVSAPPPAEGEDDEEPTADEACVHSLMRKRTAMRRNMHTAGQEAPSYRDAPARTSIKRAASHPSLGAGGVLDRVERKMDSNTVIQREKDRLARDVRDREKAGAKPKPSFMARKDGEL